MHDTVGWPMSTTERGNSTYRQQVDTAHLPKRPFTPNIAQYQQKLRWTQQRE